MLTTAEIAGWIGQMSYRPGWSFQVYETGFEDPWLLILAKNQADSRNPGASIDLGIRSPIPPMENFDQLDRWLIWRLERVESHECREWLQVDGRPIFDPHRERDRV